MRPAIGIEDSSVKLLVRQVQPGGALVVKVGERTLGEFFLAQPGRIEPDVSLLNQFFGSLGDGLYAWIVFRFVTGRPGEREGLSGRDDDWVFAPRLSSPDGSHWR
jgi:hypothetical protein